MTTIKTRSKSGMAKREIEIVGKVSLGLCATHNGDGSFSKSIALGTDGRYYETASSRSGGWRTALNQESSRNLYEAELR